MTERKILMPIPTGDCFDGEFTPERARELFTKIAVTPPPYSVSQRDVMKLAEVLYAFSKGEVVES